MSEADILFERRGAAGIVTLNRPKALNAVTHGMVRGVARAARRWADDPAITRVVVITAAGERAFSAGGDIRALYDLGKAGRHDEALQFWRDEYPLNAAIKNFRKPYVALIDGIVMGGGVGVSVHGSHRVAGDRFQFAMPEVGIGFFPMSAPPGSLPRMPGELGTYCALTGERFGIADALRRRARHPSHSVGALWRAARRACRHRFGGRGAVGVRRAGRRGADHGAARGAIDRLFAGDRVEDILDALDREAASAAPMPNGRPRPPPPCAPNRRSASNWRWRRCGAARTWDFETCMRAEFRIVSRVIQGHDFYEGVRAVIVDKDNKPRWQPATLAEVSEAEVERHFAPLGADELVLP